MACSFHPGGVANPDDKWKAVIAAPVEGRRGTAAEYANDLAMLRTLREGLEGKAVEEFGPTITVLARALHTGHRTQWRTAAATTLNTNAIRCFRKTGRLRIEALICRSIARQTGDAS